MIIEMRTHKIKPGLRSQFLALFRSKSIPAHAEIGMKNLGPFLSVEDPDTFFFMRGFPDLASREPMKDVRVKVGQGIAGWVAQHGETVVVPDTSKDTRFFSQVDEKTKTDTQSIVAVPVKFRDTCLGVIELINCIGPDGFDPRDLKLLDVYKRQPKDRG